MAKKKQHEILVTDPAAHAKVKGFVDDKHPDRPMMLDKYGRAVFHDDGMAAEIDARFGTKAKGGTGEVTVVTTEEPNEPGHRYTFGPPRGGWPTFSKEKEDAERKRLPQEEHEETEEEEKEEEEVDAL